MKETYSKKILVLVLIVFLFTTCAKTPVYRSTWQKDTKLIDGLITDWNCKMYYNSDAKMMYGISNDLNNLYVNAKVTDQAVQKKILMAGLTFWIDTTGKKTEQLGIVYPLKGFMKNQKNRKTPANKNMEKRPLKNALDYNKINDQFANNITELEMIGFTGTGKKNREINGRNKGLKVAIQFDEYQSLIYEASIPLNILFEEPQEYLTDSTKYFSYGFETGSFEVPVKMNSNTGGPGGKGSGRSGGERESGMSSGAGGKAGGRPMNSGQKTDMQGMAQPAKFWVKKASLIKR